MMPAPLREQEPDLKFRQAMREEARFLDSIGQYDKAASSLLYAANYLPIASIERLRKAIK